MKTRSHVAQEFRPGARAWVVGVTLRNPNAKLGNYHATFPQGIIHTIEFEDGSSIDVHEDDLEIHEDSALKGSK